VNALEVVELLLMANAIEDVITRPGCGGAYELPVRCPQRKENGVVNFLVVFREVELVSINQVQGWATNRVRVIRKGFNDRSIPKSNFGFESLPTAPYLPWELLNESVDLANDQLALPEAWADNSSLVTIGEDADPKEEGCHNMRLAALPAPHQNNELMVLCRLEELDLILCGFKPEDVFAEHGRALGCSPLEIIEGYLCNFLMACRLFCLSIQGFLASFKITPFPVVPTFGYFPQSGGVPRLVVRFP